jgi:UPF0755 protein
MAVGYVLYAVLRFWRILMKKRILPVLFLALVLGLAAGSLVVYRALFHQPPAPVAGLAAREVVGEQGLITHPSRFSLMVSFTGHQRDLKAGRYRLRTGMTPMDILDSLVHGSQFDNVVTIPEGLTAWQIAGLVQGRIDLDSAKFVSLIYDQNFIRDLGLTVPTLEGYLFPSTYRFPWDWGPEKVIAQMVISGNKLFKDIQATSPLAATFSRHQVLTVASIVEKETGLPEERPLVAGVFFNRLRRHMPLGADPTVRYALRKLTGPLTKRDLAVESPYNTRRFASLPPGPICNPGMAAIYATLFPTETEALFFVAMDDGSGAHFFNNTNMEHDQDKARAAKNRVMRKRGEIKAN